MADADVQITAGTGTKIDTRTVGAGTDEHRQVVVIGDPTTAANVATVDATFGLEVDVSRLPALAAGTNKIGTVVIGESATGQSAAVDSTYGLSVDITRFANEQAAVGDAESNSGVVLPVLSKSFVFNGTTWDRQRGDVTNGLDVDVTRVIPGTGPTHLGKQEDTLHVDGDTGVLILGVRNHNTGSTNDGDYSAISVDSTGNMNTLSRRDLQRIAVGITGVTTATTAYTAGDQVGVLATVANAARVTGGGGTIVGVTLIDQSDIIGAYDVVFFDSTVTLAADNAVFAISDADSLDVVAVVQLAGAFDIGNNRIAQAYNLAVPYVCTGGTSLFAALVTRLGHTFFTAGALPQLNVYVERN